MQNLAGNSLSRFCSVLCRQDYPTHPFEDRDLRPFPTVPADSIASPTSFILITAYIFRLLKLDHCPASDIFKYAVACALQRIGLPDRLLSFPGLQSFLADAFPERSPHFRRDLDLTSRLPPISVPLICLLTRFIYSSLFKHAYIRSVAIPGFFESVPDYVEADPTIDTLRIVPFLCFVDGGQIEFPLILSFCDCDTSHFIIGVALSDGVASVDAEILADSLSFDNRP
jgi:hypothetical protein